MIWKIQKKRKLKSEMIWKKAKLTSERYGKCGRKVGSIVK
jgi:hypothetical protein